MSHQAIDYFPYTVLVVAGCLGTMLWFLTADLCPRGPVSTPSWLSNILNVTSANHSSLLKTVLSQNHHPLSGDWSASPHPCLLDGSPHSAQTIAALHLLLHKSDFTFSSLSPENVPGERLVISHRSQHRVRCSKIVRAFSLEKTA